MGFEEFQWEIPALPRGKQNPALRKGKSKVKDRSRQGLETRSRQVQCKVRAKQHNHNHNYNLIGFDIIEINLVNIKTLFF